jgi:glutathione S-transferase
MYTLYVIPGSHACRSAMLMLEHKQVPYRRVDIVTLLHPLVVRLHGFDAGGQTRTAGGRRTFWLRVGDRLGTVPALAANAHRISTNHGIARFLDQRHPQPALFPADPERRRAVEEAERWANETLQMAARRMLAGAVLRDPSAFSRSSADGRMGYLLYRRALARRLIGPRILRDVFAAGPAAERELVAELPAMLNRIDAWIAAGILGGAQLNAADFMVAPSLALILYRSDVLPLFEGRPGLELVDRLLPEPVQRELPPPGQRSGVERKLDVQGRARSERAVHGDRPAESLDAVFQADET